MALVLADCVIIHSVTDFRALQCCVTTWLVEAPKDNLSIANRGNN